MTTTSLRTLRFLGQLALVLAAVSAGLPALASQRIKEVASIQGVRSNQLIGYGLVVGLDGTGDQTTQVPFTTQGLTSMLQQMEIGRAHV